MGRRYRNKQGRIEKFFPFCSPGGEHKAMRIIYEKTWKIRNATISCSNGKVDCWKQSEVFDNL